MRSLCLVAGCGQGRVADVVVEVEVGVIDPDRAALVERHEPQLLAESGHEVQAPLEVLLELLEVGGGTIEDHRRGDVHVGAVALEMKKRRVEAGQPVAAAHARIFAPR